MGNRTIISIMMSFLLCGGSVYAFDNKLTHRDLTGLAVKNSSIDKYLADQLGVQDSKKILQNGKYERGQA